MLPKELIRFSTQHRAFYCYMILSVWIFLLIAGMYKYIGQNSNLLNTKIQQKLLLADFQAVASHWSNSENLLKYRKHCTPLTSIQRLNDGGLLEGWTLQGVLLILRHGDRGPMSHVRTISALNCGVMGGDYLVNKYRSFLFNATSTSGSNHMHWNKMGAFHGLPLLPLSEKECLLGQLTYKGLAQLLHLGEILHHIYALPLGLWLKRTTNQFGKSSINSTSYAQLFSSDEVVVYTTRVRRTFQSSMAFLYTFLPPDKWLSLNIKESHSIAFCFSDCACPQADVIRRNLFGLQKQQLLHDSLVIKIMQWIGYNLLPYKTNDISSDTNEIVDAILMILCHKAEWPCRSFNNSEEGVTTSKANDLKLMDIINIDQEDLAMKNIIDINDEKKEQAIKKTQELKEKATLGCIQANQVAALLSFATRQSMQQAHHPFYKSLGLLRAYGMIRHIVSYMLRMISGDRTKFVLYSGHDWTLQYLTAALGIQTDTTFIPYATRLAIEVYKSETHVDFYFRIVYNGRDVTEQIDFCAGGKSLRVSRDSHGNKADLCPIENIIRFLHEDYFASLNATNFKDACLMPPKFNEF